MYFFSCLGGGLSSLCYMKKGHYLYNTPRLSRQYHATHASNTHTRKHGITRLPPSLFSLRALSNIVLHQITKNKYIPQGFACNNLTHFSTFFFIIVIVIFIIVIVIFFSVITITITIPSSFTWVGCPCYFVSSFSSPSLLSP